ncbi:hypothetical protein TSUD_253510 [Trifolium subterraneum]|nr:hypothetical protein TSUD_253510 [Trifolium subterraneum]
MLLKGDLNKFISTLHVIDDPKFQPLVGVEVAGGWGGEPSKIVFNEFTAPNIIDDFLASQTN